MKRAFADQQDLYDIATWEVRSRLDAFAVSLVKTVRRSKVSMLVAVALVLFLGQAGLAFGTIRQEPFLGVLGVLSVLPALAVAAYLWFDDPTVREPFVPLAATFLLAMVFAMLAAVLNSTFRPAFETLELAGLVAFFFLVVGPAEEFVKWLAIRVYAFHQPAFRTVVDGAIYGAVAGLGFAAIENFTYIVVVYLEAGPAGVTPTESAVSVATQRLFVGPGHVIFSAWAGFYLGLAKFNPDQYAPIVVKGLLIAAFIHALYNTMVTVLPEMLPLTVGGLLALIVGYHLFWLGLLYRKISVYRDLYHRLDPGDRDRPVE